MSTSDAIFMGVMGTIIIQVVWHYGAKYKKHLDFKKDAALYNEEMREKRIAKVEYDYKDAHSRMNYISQRLSKLEDKHEISNT